MRTEHTHGERMEASSYTRLHTEAIHNIQQQPKAAVTFDAPARGIASSGIHKTKLTPISISYFRVQHRPRSPFIACSPTPRPPLDGQLSSAALGSTASRPVAWFWPMDASHATLRPCVRSCTPASRCGRAVRDERLHLAESCYCAA